MVADDPSTAGPVYSDAEQASFCIGFSKAEEAIESIPGSGEYDFHGGLEFQHFACTRVVRP